MSTLLRDKMVKPKKQHICSFCGELIETGEKCQFQAVADDGSVGNLYTHLSCCDVAEELNMYQECFPDGVSDEYFQCSIDDYVLEMHPNDVDWQNTNYKQLAEKILKELKDNEQSIKKDTEAEESSAITL